MARRHLSRGRLFDESSALSDETPTIRRPNMPDAPFTAGEIVRCVNSKQVWRVHHIYFSEGPGRWFVVGRLGACKWYQWANDCVRV